MSFIYLGLAIIFEVTGTILMKMSDGLTKIIPAVFMLIFYILSLVMRTITLKTIEVGKAYAIWAGLGTALIVTIGIVFFKETLSVQKIVFILLIIGVIGLNLVGEH
jgi:small multidrug resistance pump